MHFAIPAFVTVKKVVPVELFDNGNCLHYFPVGCLLHMVLHTISDITCRIVSHSFIASTFYAYCFLSWLEICLEKKNGTVNVVDLFFGTHRHYAGDDVKFICIQITDASVKNAFGLLI